MITALSDKSDILELKSLWKQGFGDSSSFIEWYFSSRFTAEMSSVTKDGSKIVSMAFCQQMKMNIRKKVVQAAMLNGVYTLPEYRKKGLMHENVILLEKTAANKGIPIMINTPAGKNHYASLGHRYITSCDKLIIQPKRGDNISYFDPCVAQYFDQTLKIYNAMSDEFSCMIKRDQNAQKERFCDYLSDEGKFVGFFEDKKLVSYAVIYETDEKYICPECVFFGSKENIISELSKLNKPCEVKLPGKGHPTAVGAVLDAGSLLKKFNLPFSLEVVDEVIEKNNGIFSLDDDKHQPCAKISAPSLIEILSGYLELFDTSDIIIYDRGKFDQLRALFPKENCYMIEEY